MAETVTEKGVCEKCGADVRDGTLFCYACGAKIPRLPFVKEEPSDLKAQAEVDADALMAAAFGETEKVDGPTDEGDKMSQAAEQRRKSRASVRRSKEYAWEPEESPIRLLITAVIIFAISVLVVFLTVFRK